MEKNLETILNELTDIQVNLRKLGPSKRLQYKDKVEEKIRKAKELYSFYKTIIRISEQKTTLELAEYVYEVLKERIDLIYNRILTYNLQSETETNLSNMEKFDIKTATSLIPVMDGSEGITEKIIDAVELYNSCLKDTDQTEMLISFVLKTRLTKTAKLKLKSEYDDVASLIKDMKTYLLTKKSANSILFQLNNLSQNNMSINEYGNKLSELFIDLTISQADGNEKASEILRPINEKLAIKRFADGLRYKRLSTIISARNYSELKDAVRAAEDEELGQPSTSNGIFSARGKSNNRYNNHNYFNRGDRNNYNNQGSRYRGHYNTGQNYNNNSYYRQKFNGNPRGGYYTRGRGNHYSNSGNNHNPTKYFRGRGTRDRNNQRRMYPAQVSGDPQTENEKTENKNQFFRS